MNDDLHDLSGELHAVLERASDDIGSPALAARAFSAARRRRTRRRSAAAAVISSGLVVAVVVASQVGGRPTVAPPTNPSLTPSPSPTDSAGPTRWDPMTVDELPAANAAIAPTLPEVVDPPDSSPLLTDEPIDAAVVAVEDKGIIQVLGIDGSWRRVETTQNFPRTELSPEGTRMVVSYSADTESGATVYDLQAGSTQQIPFPSGYRSWDFQSWRFLDEDTLLFDDFEGGFLVDLASGDAARVPFPTQFNWSVDPTGVVVESSDVDGPSSVTEWFEGESRTVSTPTTLERIHANADSVAATSYDGRPFSVVVADRETVTLQSVLRLGDGRGKYSGAFSNGGLSVVALADDGTVLLRVAVPGEGADGFRIAAWDPGSGQLSLVSSLRTSFSASFAEGLLRSVSRPDPSGRAADRVWDQRQVDDLPAADPSIAPGLPDEIQPPATSPLLSDAPIDAAVLAVEQDDVVQVLGTDGEWRTVPSAERFPGVRLSPDGTRLVLSYFGGDRGATVHDLRTGASWETPFPDDYQPFDDTFWTFADDDTLFLGGGDDNNFLVDATTGEAERTSHGATVFDPDGAAIEVACCGGPLVLRDWAGEEARDVSLEGLGRLDSLAVSTDGVAGASYDSGDRVVRLADRATLTPRAELRTRDYSSSFGGNGGFSVLALAEDGTVILRVARIGRSGEGFAVVAWAPGSGSLSLISSNPVARSVAFADDFLRDQP